MNPWSGLFSISFWNVIREPRNNAALRSARDQPASSKALAWSGQSKIMLCESPWNGPGPALSPGVLINQ